MLRLAGATAPDKGRDGGGPGGGFDPMRAVGLSRARLLMRGSGAEPRHPTTETLRRWILLGYHPRGQGGPVLFLEARKLSGHYLVMPEWVEAFERERVRLSTLDPLEGEPTCRRREAEKRAASRELDRAGIGTPAQR